MGEEVLNDYNELITRLERRTTVDKDTGCWLWTGALNNVTHGHGILKLWKGSPKFYTHRLSAYIFLFYDMSSPLQVNHKCPNQNCWNPQHLYVGTQTDNMQDKVEAGNAGGWNKDKTHCVHGHEFTPENTYTYKRDDKIERGCKECRKINQQNYQERWK